MAAAEQRAPGAACAQHRSRPDRAALRDDARNHSGLEVEAAHRAILVNGRVQTACGFGERRSGQSGFGTTVARRMHAADPVGGAAGRHRPGFADAQDTAVHAEVTRSQGPGFPLSKVGLAGRDVQQAGPSKAGLCPDFAVQFGPELEAFHGKRQLAQIAMLLAAPAPVAAGLFAGNVPLVEQRDRYALLRERVGSRTAGHAATDHDDVGGAWQLLVACQGLHEDRHRYALHCGHR
jgi:hypothetical protein